jgi:pimeloyl-ACP methyl ester carboxylesterase
VIRRLLLAAGAVALPFASYGVLVRRGVDRLLAPPRFLPEEANLGPALDALGGEVVRLRSRDALRLAGRWLPAEPNREGWLDDPHEAILVLHGYSGSISPDLVEYAPFLRRTANVLGIDFRGHGDSDDGPTTFGLQEVEDLAGALGWLGERGIERVALFGTSMGGMTAIAGTVVLGDGRLPGADSDPDAPRTVVPAPRPRIVAIVAESIPPELPIVVANRIRGPLRGTLARSVFKGVARRLGADPRATEPIRVIGLLEGVPLLLIHGQADDTVPIASARRLVAAAPAQTESWEVPGARHSRAHATAPEEYERRVTDFVRRAFAGAREPAPIIAAPRGRSSGASGRTDET